jgi:hypothetical protein
LSSGSKAELLDACFMVISCLYYSSNLKMEAACSSETLIGIQRPTQRCIPEDGTLMVHYCERTERQEPLEPAYSCSTKFKRRLVVVWRPLRRYVSVCSSSFISSSVQFHNNTYVCFNVHFFLFLHTHPGVFHRLFVTDPCSYPHIPEPVNTEPRCHLFFTMLQHCWSSAFSSFVALFPL